MSVREIRAFLAEAYGTEASPDFISSVTDEVMADTLAWQNRPLEPMYPVVFFDALRVKIREDGVVSNKAVYLALGIQTDGEVLTQGVQRTQDARLPGHPDRRGRIRAHASRSPRTNLTFSSATTPSLRTPDPK